MQNDTLQHWGILGQKWGRRNGPPYPLGKGQMSEREWKNLPAEEKALRAEAEKQRLIKSGSAREIGEKLRGQLSPEEYTQVLARLNYDIKIAELVSKEDSLSWQNANRFINHADTVHKGFDAAANIYNDVARVVNASGTEMPLIPTVSRINDLKDSKTKFQRDEYRESAKARRDEAAKIAAEQRKPANRVKEEKAMLEFYKNMTSSEKQAYDDWKNIGNKGGVSEDKVKELIKKALEEMD